MSSEFEWDERWSQSHGIAAPSPFLEALLPHLTRMLAARTSPRALDLACGIGRHTLPLARQGIPVDSTDFSGVALSRLEHVAAREGLRVRTTQCDLTEKDAIRRLLSRGSYDLVLDFFYLERSLFPLLGKSTKPGAVFVIETRLAAGPPGSPTNRKGFWLSPGELSQHLWPDWQILALHEGAVGKESLVRAVATRKGSASGYFTPVTFRAACQSALRATAVGPRSASSGAFPAM